MKLKGLLAAGASASAMLAATPALAVTWNPATDYLPTLGPVSAPAAGGQIQTSGWFDQLGGVAIISAGNQITPPVSNTNTNILARTADTPTQDGQTEEAFVYNGNTAGLAQSNVGARYFASNGANGYACVGGGTGSIIDRVVAGAVQTIATGPTISLTSGATYYTRCAVQSTGLSATTITLTILAADHATVVTSYSVVDTTSQLQNMAGVAFVWAHTSSGTPFPISELTTYTEGPASTVSVSAPTPANGAIGTASGNFTVATDGPLTSSVVVTPKDGAMGGTFAGTTCTLTAVVGSPSFCNFTYTPAAIGPIAISLALPNGSGLVSGPSATYTALASPPAWTSTTTYAPTGGPVTAPSAGGQVQTSGWFDLKGGVGAINASNQITPPVDNTNTNILARTGDTPTEDGQIAEEFVNNGNTSGFAQSNVGERYFSSGGLANGYACGVQGNGAFIQSFAAGVGTNIVTPATIALASGSSYFNQCAVYSISPFATTITQTVYASDHSTVVFTQTVTDTTPALQGVTGVPFIYAHTSSGTPLPIQALQTYSENAATSVFLSSPTPPYGPLGSPSAPFSVGSNGPISGSLTATISDNGAGGTITSSPCTLTPVSGGRSFCTFTYTPASYGVKTLSETNSSGGSIGNGPSVSFQALTPIAPSSAMLHLSPFNWDCFQSRACEPGQTSPQAWNAGAYFSATWTASANPVAIVVLPNTAGSNNVSYVLNNVLYDNVSSQGNISINAAPNATNTLAVYVRCAADCNPTDATSRYGTTATNVLAFGGMYLDPSSTPGIATLPGGHAITACRVLLGGDSIDEGWETEGSTSFNFLHSAPFSLMQIEFANGCDVGMVASAGNGFLATGNGGVAGLFVVTAGGYQDSLSRWNKVQAGISLMDNNLARCPISTANPTGGCISAYGAINTEPTAILWNFGGNDAVQYNTGYVVPAYIAASVTGALTAYRAAAPSAKIIYEPDWPLTAGTLANSAAVNADIAAGVAAYGADANFSNPSYPAIAKYLYSNISTFMGDNPHTNVAGNFIATPMLLYPLDAALSAGSGGGTVARTFENGFFH